MGRLMRDDHGNEFRFIPIYEEITFDGAEGDAKVYIEFQHAIKAALGLLRVNVSLAIRRAFDAVYDLRLEKGGPFFP